MRLGPGLSPSNFFAALALLVACLAGAGCQSPRESSARVPPGVGPRDVAALHVISVPVGLNLDGKAGLDGISLKVYANDWASPKAVPIKSGMLEIQMFDGRLTTNSTPLRVWTFDAAKLKPLQFKSRIGTGYEFTLFWGDSKPTARAVTVRAQHTSPSGKVIPSSSSTITVEDMPVK